MYTPGAALGLPTVVLTTPSPHERDTAPRHLLFPNTCSARVLTAPAAARGRVCVRPPLRVGADRGKKPVRRRRRRPHPRFMRIDYEPRRYPTRRRAVHTSTFHGCNADFFVVVVVVVVFLLPLFSRRGYWTDPPLWYTKLRPRRTRVAICRRITVAAQWRRALQLYYYMLTCLCLGGHDHFIEYVAKWFAFYTRTIIILDTNKCIILLM